MISLRAISKTEECIRLTCALSGEGFHFEIAPDRTGGGGETRYQRIESFLGDVLALAGEDPDAVRDGVRVALAKCEAIFRLQKPKKRMRDQAAHACRALCRARVAEELQRRRGTRIGEHLKLVLSIIDRQER